MAIPTLGHEAGSARIKPEVTLPNPCSLRGEPVYRPLRFDSWLQTPAGKALMVSAGRCPGMRAEEPVPDLCLGAPLAEPLALEVQQCDASSGSKTRLRANSVPIRSACLSLSLLHCERITELTAFAVSVPKLRNSSRVSEAQYPPIRTFSHTQASRAVGASVTTTPGYRRRVEALAQGPGFRGPHWNHASQLVPVTRP